MFDSAPPNLPVDPTQAPVEPSSSSPVVSSEPDLAPSSPSPSPAPASAPAPTSVAPVKGQKEPEDIFSGLDQSKIISGGPVAMPSVSRQRRFSPVMLVGGVIVGLLVLGGVAFAVWVFVLKPSPQETAQAPSAVQPSKAAGTVVEQVEQPPVIDQLSQPVTQPPAGVIIPPPVITQSASDTGAAEAAVSSPTTAVAAVGEGKDTDADGLTDAEEAFYGADSANTDTDGDGYIDGQETMNLFSPIAKGKALAAESFMQQLTWNGLSFLLPKPWSMFPDPASVDRMAITTGSATRFAFDVRPNLARQPIVDWLGDPERAKSLMPFKTKGGFDALQTPDGLVAYIPLGDKVLVVTYDVNGDASYEYRTSIRMVLHSLAMTAVK